MHDDLTAEPVNDLTRTLLDGAWDEASPALAELGRRARDGDAAALTALIEGMSRGPYNASQEAAGEWEYIVETLERVGAAAVEPLIAALGDHERSVGVRTGAARALGNIGDARALGAMLATLTDEGQPEEVRGMAAFYVGRLHDRRATRLLLAIASSSTEPATVRRNAVHSLGELRDPEGFDGLVALLDDPTVGRFASSALEELRSPRGLDRLLRDLGSEDDEGRFATAAIVGKLGDAAFAPLLELLASPDPLRREGAATALGFGHAPALNPLVDLMLHDPEARVRAAAAHSVAYVGEEGAIEQLLRALEDEDVPVRLAAAQGFYHLALTGRLPTNLLPAELLPRMERLAAHDEGTIQGHPVVREAAVRVVRELGGRA